jgi:hypothetical protein
MTVSTENQTLAGIAPPSPAPALQGLGPIAQEPPGDIAAVETPTLADYHADFANFEEGYIRHYISLADTKAGLAFGANVGLLSFLLNHATFKATIVKPAFTVSYVEGVLAAVFLLLSLACAILVVAPRRAHSNEGFVFFDSVSAHPSASAYLDRVSKAEKSTLTEARLKHCYDVAKACSRKYDMLRRAIWFGVTGLVLFFTFIAAK